MRTPKKVCTRRVQGGIGGGRRAGGDWEGFAACQPPAPCHPLMHVSCSVDGVDQSMPSRSSRRCSNTCVGSGVIGCSTSLWRTSWKRWTACWSCTSSTPRAWPPATARWRSGDRSVPDRVTPGASPRSLTCARGCTPWATGVDCQRRGGRGRGARRRAVRLAPRERPLPAAAGGPQPGLPVRQRHRRGKIDLLCHTHSPGRG